MRLECALPVISSSSPATSNCTGPFKSNHHDEKIVLTSFCIIVIIIAALALYPRAICAGLAVLSALVCHISSSDSVTASMLHSAYLSTVNCTFRGDMTTGKLNARPAKVKAQTGQHRSEDWLPTSSRPAHRSAVGRRLLALRGCVLAAVRRDLGLAQQRPERVLKLRIVVLARLVVLHHERLHRGTL